MRLSVPILALLALAALAGLVAPARAQGLPPAATSWSVGLVQPGAAGVSWWYRAQEHGRAPSMTTIPPGHGWAICPGPEDEPQQCTVSAAGPWRVLIVEGLTLWRRERLSLPAIAAGGP